jgi:hypothetical protein
MASGREVRTLRGHDSIVWDLAFSPNTVQSQIVGWEDE